MLLLPSLLPRGLETMYNAQPELGFNVSPAITPGFRVGLPEDLPGFRINQDGSVRRVSSSNAPAYGFNPYALNLSVAASPTAPPTPVATDDYGREIIANCRTKCSARYEALGGGLGFPWMRVCIRDCVAPSGCSY